MKKLLLVLVLVSALAVLVVSVAVANPPSGVGPAVKFNDSGVCSVSGYDWYYEGSSNLLISNGATGHSTWKCKVELSYGPPQYLDSESSSEDCVSTLSLEGRKGMVTSQCVGIWQ